MNMNITKLVRTICGLSITTSAGLFAQSSCAPALSCTSPGQFEPGYELCGKFPAGYNAAARIDVCNSWDFFATASFTYWHADQDGMDLGVDNVVNIPNGDVLFQDFKYSPGFKVGLGMNFGQDNWIGFTEYTWFRQKTTTNYSREDGIYTSNIWGVFPPASVTDIQARWHLHLDILDTVLSRPFYQGRALTVQPFGGLRAAWIRQQWIALATVTNIETSTSVSHSWAVGPRVGTKAHWLLGWGFRIEGDIAGSILYTKYHTNADAGHKILKQHDYGTLRPELDFGLGLGWGTYLDRQNYHLDILATYDFNIFWKQNMMRPLDRFTTIFDLGVAGDLNLHGLTITTRFDF